VVLRRALFLMGNRKIRKTWIRGRKFRYSRSFPIQTKVRFGTTGSNSKVGGCITTIPSVYYWRISLLKVVGFSKKLITICETKPDYIPSDHNLNIEYPENL